MNEPPTCPSCGADRVVPIAYGFPGQEMWAAADRGEVVLGGCVVGAARWRCVECDLGFI